MGGGGGLMLTETGLLRSHQCIWAYSLQALLRGSLRKAFSGFDLLLLGLGIVIGSGWAQLSGVTAQQFAG